MTVATPPSLASRLLRRSLPRDRYDDIAGDLEELFMKRCRTQGPGEARFWYWREVLMLSVRFCVERMREATRWQPAGRMRGAGPARPKRFGIGFGVSAIDVRLGVRMLLKNPGLTVVSTVALAIAIAIIAGFHTATQFMVSPKLPVPDGDRIVAIWQHDTISGDTSAQTLGDMLTWRTELDSLDEVGAFRLQERGVTINGATRLVRAAEMTPAIFEMLRTPPALGRPLVEEDTRPGSSDVAVIGYDFWQNSLGADPAIVGSTLRIGGTPHVVVGVMPSGFAFPRREDIWTPLEMPGATALPDSGPTVDFSVARLADGATLDDANVELQLAGARLAAAYPDTHARLRPRVSGYARSFLDAAEPELPMLMHAARTAIGIVLLVVAINVGTLIYARNAARLAEIAVRMALGASRRRVVWQMFIEALVLSTLAAAGGLAILWWPVSRFREVFDTALAQGDALPYWFKVGIGTNTLLLVGALALLSAVMTGVLPALKLTSREVQSRLQRIQQGSSGLRFGRTTTLVVVSQVALSVALLTVGGAQLQNFIKGWWSHEDLDTSRNQLLTAQVRWDLGSGVMESDDAGNVQAHAATRRELGRRAERELDLLGATFDSYQGIRFFVPDSPRPEESSFDARWTYVSAIEPNYFDVRGTPLVSGRTLTEGDRIESAARVAVVNEAFARATLAPGDPVGQRIRQIDPRSRQASGEWLRIVGVVRDNPSIEISQRGPEWISRPAVFFPLPDAASGVRMLIRARGNPEQVVGRLEALAAEVDPSLVLHRAQTFESSDRMARTFVGLYGIAVGFFVFAALLLSTTGVYAMMSFTTTQRTREIGIRSALGAPARRVIGDVFSRAMKQLGLGLVIGLGLGYLGADGPLALSNGLFDEGPGVVFAVAVLILLMGLIACGRPMRRALSIAPTEALRTDS